MQVIYNDKTDTLLMLNPTGNPAENQGMYKSTIFIDFDVHRVPIMIEINEASVTLGIPKIVLKQFVRDRK